MWKQVFGCLGIKKPNRNDELKTVMDEGASHYVNEAKRQEILFRELVVDDFNSGRMSRDHLKALEKMEKSITASHGLSGSCTEWRPDKEILYDFIEEWKELKKMKELNVGENEQPHTADKEFRHTGRENAVTEVLKPKAYQPKSEVENAAPIHEMMLPRTKKALEVVVGLQTGDVEIKIGMPISTDLMEAKFPKSAAGWGGSAEVVGSWNVQLGMCLMGQYSSGKTSRDCLKLLEVEKENLTYGEQTEWSPDIEFPEQITSTSKEEKSLPDKVRQNG